MCIRDRGWTQQQIATQLGLARPTISNTVRLLRLPGDMQAQVAAAGLSARQADALLSFVEIPQDIKDKAETYWSNDLRPSTVISHALAGASSDDIRRETTGLLKRYTQTVHAVSYTHLRAHETVLDLVCRLLLETKKNPTAKPNLHIELVQAKCHDTTT